MLVIILSALPAILASRWTAANPDDLAFVTMDFAVSASFIAPMLCDRLTDPRRLSEHRYIAEPKLDGQRAQLHVHRGTAVACYSRRGLDLLEHAGMAWLKVIKWPFESGVFDGEACAGDGHEGIQAVFAERPAGRRHGAVLFDLLYVQTKSVMREPWRDRRKRLEDLLDGRRLPRMALVPVTDDAPTLYETWVGLGGEGIVLKDPASLYRPGDRSPAWLKVKPSSRSTCMSQAARRTGSHGAIGARR